MNRTLLAASAAVLALAFSGGAAARPHAGGAPQLTPAAPDAEGFSTDRLKLLDAAMDHAVEAGEVAGVETMLVRHGRIVDLHLKGVKNTAGYAIARDTIFRMYSQTKPMIGVAMMILFEEGRWRLDDPITKFIPEFANLKVMASVGADGKPVLEDMKRPPTMRELMTHTAGFGYGLRGGNPVDDAFRAQKVLASDGLKAMIDKIATIPLLYQPGTKWSYSAAVDIQGYIIEKLSGQRLGDFMAERIFKPLGMKDTGFYVPPANGARLSGVPLADVEVGAAVRVLRFENEAEDLLHYLKSSGLEPGLNGTLAERDDEQVVVEAGNGSRCIVTTSVAETVSVIADPSPPQRTALPDQLVLGQRYGR